MGLLYTEIAFGQTLALPIRPPNDHRPTPVVFDLTPHRIAKQSTQLNLSFTIIPPIFDDGARVPRYEISYKQACFWMCLDDGALTVSDVNAPKIHIEKNDTKESERGADLKPKVEVKIGSENTGLGVEFVGFSKKAKVIKGRKISGVDDGPILDQIVREDAGCAYWMITRSPLADAKTALRASHSVQAQCFWQAEHKGRVRLFARGKVMCDADGRLGRAEDILVKLVYWVRARECFNSLEPYGFQVIERAA